MSASKPTVNETPEEFKGLHKFFLGIAAFFFIYLVIQGFLLGPFLYFRYGLH